MSKHTPGPWSIHYWTHAETGVTYKGEENGVKKYTGQTDPLFQIVADADHLKTSNTFGSFEGCHIAEVKITHDGYDEALANTRLLSAAPELCDALERVLYLVAYSSAQHPFTDRDIENFRSAVKKARGRA